MRPAFYLDSPREVKTEDLADLKIDEQHSFVNAIMAGHDLMRIKVFPHKYDYPPHGRDQSFSSFSIESEKPCKLFKGQESVAGRFNTILASVQTLSVNASKLKHPLWLECPGVFKIVRKGDDLQNYSYTGNLYITKRQKTSENLKLKSSPELIAVNIIPLETYLKGVVPVEVSASWPLETLKAQAVAARSYALFHMESSQKKSAKLLAFYDLDDSIIYQAFTGVTNVHPATDKAVDETLGQVLVYDKKIIQAYYHADSGGMTANPIEAFGVEVPYCKAKKEPRSKTPKKQWQQMVSLNQVTFSLRQKGLLKPGQFLAGIKVGSKRQHSKGRNITVEARLTNGQNFELSASRFRQIFRLQSRMFELKTIGQEVLIIGYGSGHGVGLSQVGAKTLAREFSWDYSKILKFYYSNINLCTVHRDLGTSKAPFCLKQKPELAAM